ncbi:MAG: hypothetical protein C4308_10635 [Chitinophagaceae bacterium]
MKYCEKNDSETKKFIMKNLFRPGNLKYFFVLVLFNLFQFTIWAQDQQGDNSTSSSSSTTIKTTTKSTE